MEFFFVGVFFSNSSRCKRKGGGAGFGIHAYPRVWKGGAGGGCDFFLAILVSAGGHKKERNFFNPNRQC